MPGILDKLRELARKSHESVQAELDKLAEPGPRTAERERKYGAALGRLRAEAGLRFLPMSYFADRALPEAVRSRVSLSPITADSGQWRENNSLEEIPGNTARDAIDIIKGKRKINLGGTLPKEEPIDLGDVDDPDFLKK